NPERRAGRESRIARSAKSEWRILVREEQEVRLDTRIPAEDSDRVTVERVRVLTREEDRHPGDHRRQHPTDAQHPEGNQVRQGQEQTETDGQSIPLFGWRTCQERHRVFAITQRWE